MKKTFKQVGTLFAVSCLSFSVLSAPLTSQSTTAVPFTPEQETRIKQLIRETLVENPDILIEASLAYEATMQQELAKQEGTQLALLKNEIYNDQVASPQLGESTAGQTLVYFTDYNCPYCKRFEQTLAELQKNNPNLNIIIRPVPYLGEESRLAAELVLTVWQTHPDKFAALHQAFMNHKSRLDEVAIKAILKQQGLSDLKPSTQATQALLRNLHLAQQLGITGTPSTIYNDQIIKGAVDSNHMQQLLVK